MTALRNLDIHDESLTDFCQRWKITELALFGSALRSNIGPGSDIDLLVSFRPAAEWSLLDHLAMQEELS
ncbi:MAG: nucleotidyltransferase, partial [Chloroflexi bacterium]|nr:nucleotidyltransferase [Chloroflexota bacterium]